MTATDVTMLLSEMKNEPLAVSRSAARGGGIKSSPGEWKSECYGCNNGASDEDIIQSSTVQLFRCCHLLLAEATAGDDESPWRLDLISLTENMQKPHNCYSCLITAVLDARFDHRTLHKSL